MVDQKDPGRGSQGKLGARSSQEINLEDAATLLSMSVPSVKRLINRGLLSAKTAGSCYRLGRAEVVEYKQMQTRAGREGLAQVALLSEEYDF